MQGGRRSRIVIATCTQHTAVGEAVGGWQVHRIVSDGSERDGGNLGGRPGHPLCLAEHTRQDAVRHRPLMPASVALAIEPRTQLSERRRLVLVVPDGLESLVVCVQRSLECLDGQREHVIRKLQTTLRCDGRVGDEGSSARRAVDEREAFLLAQVARLDQRAEEMAESEDLARASVSLLRYRGKQPAIVQK